MAASLKDQEVGFTCPFVVNDPTNLGAKTVVAPGLMLDNFLPIPDAESLPFYHSVLKLVVCAGMAFNNALSPESERWLSPLQYVAKGLGK